MDDLPLSKLIILKAQIEESSKACLTVKFQDPYVPIYQDYCKQVQIQLRESPFLPTFQGTVSMTTAPYQVGPAFTVLLGFMKGIINALVSENQAQQNAEEYAKAKIEQEKEYGFKASE